MTSFEKTDVCFIRAKLKNDYVVKGREAKGYRNYIPYRDYNLLFRLLREIWFRLRLPQRIWFNPQIKDVTASNIIINDPLITPEFVAWVRELFPERKIYLVYENRASCTLDPDAVRIPSIIKCSYDEDDCSRYGMHYLPGGYPDVYRLKTMPRDKYDIVYVGRDKGRGEKLLELEQEFKKLGLKTYFHICGDRRVINKHKRYYKPLLDYTEYLSLISRSKAILNIMPEGQKALTMRDFEVVFNGIKGITNSQWIQSFELYDPSRFFILGLDDIGRLPDFLAAPFKPISEEELYPFSDDVYMEKLLAVGSGETL